jgi:hypothetical protein
MKKAKDEDFANAPNLQEWINGAIEERKLAEKKQKIGQRATDPRFSTLKPENSTEFMAAFKKARGLQILDIGVIDNFLILTLLGAEMVVTFKDPNIRLVPHANGMVVDFHEFKQEILTEITSYVPTVSAITSCIFVIQTDNGNFEYLIEVSSQAQTLEFEVTFDGDDNA